MLKKCKVVMLPTNEKAQIIKQLDAKQHLILTPIYEWKLTHNWEYQHLYFLSDEEIKVGDWCYGLLNGNSQIFQYKDEYGVLLTARKIIATTDNLYITQQNRHLGQAIIKLSEPSQGFIEKFVKQYNKGNIITEVMVEYDECPFDNGHTKVNPKDNTITIKRLKDSWTREELEKACTDAFDSAREFDYIDGIVDIHIVMSFSDCRDLKPVYPTAKEWIEKNL
jgi:hypothetical protein